MENRDRDKVSRRDEPTEAGDINRDVTSRIGNENDDSSAEFGQKIGRSEDLNEPNERDRTGDSKGEH
jgi:hypothetical protein